MKKIFFFSVLYILANSCQNSSADSKQNKSYKPLLTEQDYQDYKDYQNGDIKLSKTDCSVLSLSELIELYNSKSRHQWLKAKNFMLTQITRTGKDPKITSNLEVLPTSLLDYSIECSNGVNAKITIKEDSGKFRYNIFNKNYVEAKKLREIYKEEAIKMFEPIDNSKIGSAYVFKKDDYYIVIHKQVQARLPVDIGRDVSFR